MEPAGASGANPFTPSTVVNNVITLPTKAAAATAATRDALPTDPKTHARVATGTAPGLYGGSGDTHVCNPEQLVAFLKQDADKAAAWARVLNVAPTDIASYVASLTPVVLTGDTLVTNHGFRDGHATSLESVLQAGTAVLVDTTGTPRVKCNCGNPLTPPETLDVASAHTTGTRWSDYQSNNVTSVFPGAPVREFTLVDISTGGTYSQATGSGTLWVAAKDNPLAVGGGNAKTTIATSTDGATWSDVSTITGVAVTGVAFGNGTWIAVGTSSDVINGGTVLQSTDLAHWSAVATGLSHLDAVAYGEGRWVAVGSAVAGVAVGGLNHASRVAYTSTDASHWSEVDISNDDPNDSNLRTLTSVGYGEGTWLAAGINERDDATGRTPSKLSLATFTSANGTTWSHGAHWDSTLTNAQAGNGFDPTAIAHAPEQWTLAASLRSGGIAQRTSTDASTWTDVPGTPFQEHPIEALASGAGTWLAAARAGSEPETSLAGGPTNVYSSNDGTLWKQTGTIPTHVAALAYGPSPAQRAPRQPATTTTATPPTPHTSPATTPATTTSPRTTPPRTTPPTTASPAGNSTPACNQSVFQALLNARSPGAQALQVWCAGTWAIVQTSTAKSGLVAWHFDGDIWNNLGEYVCGTPPPSGMPQTLVGQMCEHG